MHLAMPTQPDPLQHGCSRPPHVRHDPEAALQVSVGRALRQAVPAPTQTAGPLWFSLQQPPSQRCDSQQRLPGRPHATQTKLVLSQMVPGSQLPVARGSVVSGGQQKAPGVPQPRHLPAWHRPNPGTTPPSRCFEGPPPHMVPVA
jgi:hypothetical protein